MNQEKFLAIIRHLLTAAGGIIVTLGITTDATVASVSGAVLTLAATAWSLWEKSNR